MLDWADQLIQEYTDGRQQLRRKADQLNRDNPLDMQDLKQFNSMIESMSYSLEWMQTGRQPGTYRGAEESNVYQKRSYENMDWLPDLEVQLREENDINKKHLFMTREEKIILADILSSFSLRERQCYLLHKGQKKSMSDIAEGLGVSKSMVQQSIRRAKKKISDRTQKDL